MLPSLATLTHNAAKKAGKLYENQLKLHCGTEYSQQVRLNQELIPASLGGSTVEVTRNSPSQLF